MCISVFITSTISNAKTNLDSVHKRVVDILGLHFLTNQVGNAAKNGVDGGDLAIPSEKCRYSGSITAG